WVLFMDVDEYIHVVEPPHSLLVFLNSVPAIPWLSFGSLTFPLDICGKIQEAGWEPWAVEQLVFREPVPHCKEPTKYYSRDACLKWDGHRKYVVNPRAAQVLQIHRVYELNAAYDANAPPDAGAAASGAAAAALLATSGREEGKSTDNGNGTGNSTSVGALSGANFTGKLIPVDDVQGLLIGSTGGGLNLHTNIIRVNHYRGLGIRYVPMCRQIIALSLPAPKGVVRDINLARIAVASRLRSLDAAAI
ncbi:unnamed protein product, partial [Closterium sp. NIES-54]